MLGPCLLFVTAPEADHKAINRLLLYLRDWEYGSEAGFCLVTSRSVDTFLQQYTLTSAPVARDGPANEWVGASIAEIEAFCLDPRVEEGSVFVVLDSHGLADKTCVIADKAVEYLADSESFDVLQEFNKARVTWPDIYIIWCNLDIGNMSWDDYMEEDESGQTEGRWWTALKDNEITSEDNKKRRDEEIKRFEDQGLA